MKTLAPNTPVIVGVGYAQQHDEDPAVCSEPYQLMVAAIRDAAEDAGSAKQLLAGIDSISVQQGMWEYVNPGKLLADELGCPLAKSILADLGVLQLTPLSELCQSIANGEQHIGVVTGGEAKYRELRGKITGQRVSNTAQPGDTPLPDIHHQTSDPFASELEAQRGMFMPVEFFAMIESALRYEQGLDIDAHRDKIAELYSGFSRIAANNPQAWRREPVAAKDIRNPSEKNAMIAFPYTKRHNSQWNVNQAVAIVVCSAAKARQLGLLGDRWIYPLSSVQSKHVVCLAQQKQLHSHPGTVMSGERALTLAGVSRGEIDAADLYSCFPAAVRSFAHDLKLDEQCPLSVSGSMAFAGGPYNHGALDGVAAMVEALRSGASSAYRNRQVGLVTNLSGIFGKQACALFSNEPGEQGYHFEDITAAVAERDRPLPLNGDYVGAATIVGYTVVYSKGEPSHGIAICDIPGGERTVVRSDDKAMLDSLTRQEFCGRDISVLAGGGFSLRA